MGQRPEYLFLHGFMGHPSQWDPVRAFLPSTSTVQAPHLPGHGGAIPDSLTSAKESAGSQDIDSVAHYEALVATLASTWLDGRSEVHLVGYSMGARIALGLVLARPEAFSRVTLIGVNPGLKTAPERSARRATEQQWQEQLLGQGLESFVDSWQTQPLFSTQSTLPSEHRAQQREIRLGHDPKALAWSLATLGLGAMPDYREPIRHIEQPVTLLVGALDSKFRALAQELENDIPCVRLSIVPGAGHNLVLEQPHAVAQTLLGAHS